MRRRIIVVYNLCCRAAIQMCSPSFAASSFGCNRHSCCRSARNSIRSHSSGNFKFGSTRQNSKWSTWPQPWKELILMPNGYSCLGRGHVTRSGGLASRRTSALQSWALAREAARSWCKRTSALKSWSLARVGDRRTTHDDYPAGFPIPVCQLRIHQRRGRCLGGGFSVRHIAAM